ncbi:MAG: DHH family phosphoesterase [Candidatus Magasanikbacteria bacterium]|nr:DHH family phosphoesterase [Candidatus Magasanikbacteria bacterium]
MHRTAKQIYQAIQRAEHLLLVPHPNPDGDALGSVAALMQWLRLLDKRHLTFCVTPISPKLRYLPHVEYITNDREVWRAFNFDTVIVVDSGDLRYAGIADHLANLSARPTIINIDHHATNEHFGVYNLVDTAASSTTEVLYRFFRTNDVMIDPYIATCLLTGVMTDTDHFTNAATSAHSLAVASELIKRGGDMSLIRGAVFFDKTIATLKLWGGALARLQKHDELDIVYTHVTQNDLQTHRVEDSEVEGLANFMNNLNDGRAALILKELSNGNLKGSFRTTKNDVDVSAWAKALGGGGHKKAAGFTVPGPVEIALQNVFAKIQETEK